MSVGDGRTYLIKGRELPSVTTILSVLGKPALINWAAKAERDYFLKELQPLMNEPTGLVSCKSLAEKTSAWLDSPLQANVLKNKAAEIGSKAHALIEWEIRGILKQERGEKPIVPETSLRAFEAWKQWAASVAFEPLEAEQAVYSFKHGYAGTMDLYARVEGRLQVVDWKTSKAIYPESYLQNIAYREAANELGKPSDGGLILRLPKNEGDPPFEAVPVPAEVTFDQFLAAFALWKFQRRWDTFKQAKEVKPKPINPYEQTQNERELAEWLDQQEEKK